MMETILKMIMYGWPFFAAVACGYLNRVRGAGDEEFPNWPERKFTAITLMSFIGLVPLCYGFIYHHVFNSLELVGVAVFYTIGMHLLLRVSWGEIFPHTKDTYDHEYAWGVRTISNLIVGYKYNESVADNDLKETVWKVSAWVGRMGVYGVIAIVCIAYSTQSIVPIVLWPFLCLWFGFFYLRPYITDFIGDKIAWSEKASGAFIGFIFSLLCLI